MTAEGGNEPRFIGNREEEQREEAANALAGMLDREALYPPHQPHWEATVTLDVSEHMGLISRIDVSPADPSRSTSR